MVTAVQQLASDLYGQSPVPGDPIALQHLAVAVDANNISGGGTVSGALTVSGILTASSDFSVAGVATFSGTSTFSGLVTIHAPPSSSGALLLNSGINDPVARANEIDAQMGVVLSADNGQDYQTIISQMFITPNGHTAQGIHNSSLWGQSAMLGASGTVSFLYGTTGKVWNAGTGGTITKGSSFFARSPDALSGSAAYTNAFAFVQEAYPNDGTRVTNAYGFNVCFPSGIGLLPAELTFPGAMLDVQGAGNSSASRALRVRNSDGTGLLEINNGSAIGVFGATPVTKPTVTGSRGGNAALASLVTALASFGWITDSTS